MNSAVQEITWQGLALAFVPTALVLAIMWRWAAGVGTGIYATFRMLAQLLLIGYVLVYIFDTGQPAVVLAVLGFMLLVSSWISIRPLQGKSRRLAKMPDLEPSWTSLAHAITAPPLSSIAKSKELPPKFVLIIPGSTMRTRMPSGSSS